MDETHIHQKRLLNVYIKTEPLFCEHQVSPSKVSCCTVCQTNICTLSSKLHVVAISNKVLGGVFT